MKLPVKGAEFEKPKPGMYPARCYRLCDMGTQRSNFGEKRKVLLSFELVGTVMPDDKEGRPFTIHKQVTASLHEKATLRGMIHSWLNRKMSDEEAEEFEIESLVGTACQVHVMHSPDGKYANVENVLPANEEDVGPCKNEPVVFLLDNPDMEVYGKLSENMQKKIAESPEFKAIDETPF